MNYTVQCPCHLYCPYKRVLLKQAQHPDSNGHQPLFIPWTAGLAKCKQANGPAHAGGHPQVEQDDQLLHLLGYQLGEDDTQGRQEAGGQHQAVT